MIDASYLLEQCNGYCGMLRSNLSTQDNQRKKAHLLEAIYTALLIRLYDILKSLEEKRTLIAFSEDVDTDSQNDIKDIFDLIRIHRNAACHTKSGRKQFKDTKTIFSFNIVAGYNPKAFKIGSEYYAGNDYHDDIAIYYGHWRVYFKRHIERLLHSLKNFA